MMMMTPQQKQQMMMMQNSNMMYPYANPMMAGGMGMGMGMGMGGMNMGMGMNGMGMGMGGMGGMAGCYPNSQLGGAKAQTPQSKYVSINEAFNKPYEKKQGGVPQVSASMGGMPTNQNFMSQLSVTTPANNRLSATVQGGGIGGAGAGGNIFAGVDMPMNKCSASMNTAPKCNIQIPGVAFPQSSMVATNTPAAASTATSTTATNTGAQPITISIPQQNIPTSSLAPQTKTQAAPQISIPQVPAPASAAPAVPATQPAPQISIPQVPAPASAAPAVPIQPAAQAAPQITLPQMTSPMTSQQPAQITFPPMASPMMGQQPPQSQMGMPQMTPSQSTMTSQMTSMMMSSMTSPGPQINLSNAIITNPADGAANDPNARHRAEPSSRHVDSAHEVHRAPFVDRSESSGCFKSLDDLSEMFHDAESLKGLEEALVSAGIPAAACKTIAATCTERAKEIYPEISDNKRFSRLTEDDIATLVALVFGKNSGLQAEKYPLNIINVALSGVRTDRALKPVIPFLSKVLAALHNIPRFADNPPKTFYTYATWKSLPYVKGAHGKWNGFMPLVDNIATARTFAGSKGTVIEINGFHFAYDVTPFYVAPGSSTTSASIKRTSQTIYAILEPETSFTVNDVNLTSSPSGADCANIRVTVDPMAKGVVESKYPTLLVRTNNNGEGGGDADGDDAGAAKPPSVTGGTDSVYDRITKFDDDDISDKKGGAPPENIIEVLSRPSDTTQRLASGQMPTVDHFSGCNPTDKSMILRWTCYRNDVNFKLFKKKKGFGKGKLEQIYEGEKVFYLCESLDPDTLYEFRLIMEYKGRTNPPMIIEARTLPSSVSPMSKMAWRICPDKIDSGKAYRVSGSPYARNVLKMNGNKLCAVLGSNPLPPNSVSVWGIHIAASKKDDCSAVCIGVAPSGIDLADSKNYLKNGWYLNCFNFTLCSGPPQNISFDKFGETRKKGEYLKIGDVILCEMDMKKGTLSFITGGVQKVAFEGIPKNKPLVPIVSFFLDGDSFDLIV